MMLGILIIALVVGFLLLAVVSKSNPKSKNRRQSGSFDVDVVHSRWATISGMSNQGGNGQRQALMEADKLLDYVMKGKGYHGDTMAERLRSAQNKLSNRDAVWRAHKLRNTLAHEVGFEVRPSQIQSALKEFKRAIHELGGGL